MLPYEYRWNRRLTAHAGNQCFVSLIRSRKLDHLFGETAARLLLAGSSGMDAWLGPEWSHKMMYALTGLSKESSD
jgi:hypothetical protein